MRFWPLTKGKSTREHVDGKPIKVKVTPEEDVKHECDCLGCTYGHPLQK